MKSYDEIFFGSTVGYSTVLGLLSANETYANWSKNEYPLEVGARDFVSGHIIDQLVRNHGLDDSLQTNFRFTIRDDFESIAGKLGLKKQFDPSLNGQCDVVSWSDMVSPRGLIVLLTHFEETKIKEELNRIAGMLTRFGRRNGPLRWATIAGIRGIHNATDEDKARWYLDSLRAEWSQQNHAGFDLTSSFKKVENVTRKSDDDYLGFAAYALSLELKTP
jgi:hypothetical protein